MRGDELGQLTDDELLRRYRDGATPEERREAGRELDRRRHAAEVARARPRPPALARDTMRKVLSRWPDGRSAAAGDREDDEC